MATISLRGLTRRYGGAEAAALSGLDLEVADGELLVLVGPSGCGKSTALRLIAGLDVPDGGSVLLDGTDMSRTPPQDRDVAMVFQGYALYPHLTARDIMAFPLKMRRVPRSEQLRRVDEAASMLGIGRLLDRRPGELSGGERQRVAMGRAIVRKPKAFLFDEPLSNLDAALRAELRVEISSLVRRLQITSVYVTHDQVEAMTLGDRVAVMRAGLLQQVAPPRVIYEDPDNVFVAGFLGTPPINLIELSRDDGRLRREGVDLPVPASLALPQKVVLGVRPEQLTVSEPGAAERKGSSPGTASIEASVIASEPLGPETILYLEAAGAALRARVPGFGARAPGAQVALDFDPMASLWFDAKTGARIRA